MGLFLTRTLTDGLLETRRYKLRCLAENSLGAGTPSAIVIVATPFLGGGAGSIFFAVVASLPVLVVAASVRSARAATLWASRSRRGSSC